MDGAALMKIAMIQMEVDSGQKDRNIRHAFQLLEQAVPNSDVLVLPELWTIGYDFHNLDKNATRLGDSLISGLSSCYFGGGDASCRSQWQDQQHGDRVRPEWGNPGTVQQASSVLRI